jgi:hypothetical protein
MFYTVFDWSVALIASSYCIVNVVFLNLLRSDSVSVSPIRLSVGVFNIGDSFWLKLINPNFKDVV